MSHSYEPLPIIIFDSQARNSDWLTLSQWSIPGQISSLIILYIAPCTVTPSEDLLSCNLIIDLGLYSPLGPSAFAHHSTYP